MGAASYRRQAWCASYGSPALIIDEVKFEVGMYADDNAESMLCSGTISLIRGRWRGKHFFNV